MSCPLQHLTTNFATKRPITPLNNHTNHVSNERIIKVIFFIQT